MLPGPGNCDRTACSLLRTPLRGMHSTDQSLEHSNHASAEPPYSFPFNNSLAFSIAALVVFFPLSMRANASTRSWASKGRMSL